MLPAAPARADAFGPEARAEMRRIIGDQVVRCELNGERSYERWVGVCHLPDGTDIGAEIIHRGLALDCARWSLGTSCTSNPTVEHDLHARDDRLVKFQPGPRKINQVTAACRGYHPKPFARRSSRSSRAWRSPTATGE